MFLIGNAALPSGFQVDIYNNKADVQSLLQKVVAHCVECEAVKKKHEAEELRQQQERKELDAKLDAAMKAEEDLMRQLSAMNQRLKEKDAEIEQRKQAESALQKELKEKDAEIEQRKQAESALQKELSNLKSSQDVLRLALEEENQRALSTLRSSLEANLAASKKAHQ